MFNYFTYMGFSGISAGKESACNAGDPSSILGSGRSPGEWNGYPFQNSCLENSMDRGAQQAIVCGVAKNQTRLSDFHFTDSESCMGTDGKEPLIVTNVHWDVKEESDPEFCI